MNNLVMISANTAWNLASRNRLIQAIKDTGREVIAMAAPDSAAAKLEAASGIRFIPLPMKSDSTNILEDIALFITYIRLYRKYRPSIALHLNNKPNIYGSLAASLCGIKSVANITGLGIVAEKKGFTRFLVHFLYKIAFFSRKTHVFFQNTDDREYFYQNNLVKPERTGLIPGSGVDTEAFSPDTSISASSEDIRFIYIGRLVLSKGIRLYIEAARNVKLLCKNVKFTIIGENIAGNSAFLPSIELEEAIRDTIVEYHGSVDDVKPYIAAADCVVSPSWYREGVPRVLLEAASMGIPLIAADSVGTREPVEDGINGFLIPPRDREALQNAMIRFIHAPSDEKRRMGLESRRIAMTRFSVSFVIDMYLAQLPAIMTDN